VARRVLGDQGSGVPPLRPHARSTRRRRGRGGAVDRCAAARPSAREMYQRSSLALGWACARAGVHIGTRASGPRGHAREREREHHSAASRTRAARRGARRREGLAKTECVCALTKAATPANDLTQPGTMAGITSGGAAARCDGTFPLGSKAGASTRAGKCSSSPWWPRAVVQALVKCGGAARRRGGRRRRRRYDVEEVEEVGEVGVLGDGGSGSSHGRIRSSRRTTLPWTAPIPPSPPFTSLLLRWVGGPTGERFPPRRLGLGAPRGSRRRLL
jgi:hypothetical protein